MAAQYLVRFDDGRAEWVFSADAKSCKLKDIRASYVSARKKAEAKHLKVNPAAKAVEVKCVG